MFATWANNSAWTPDPRKLHEMLEKDNRTENELTGRAKAKVNPSALTA